MRRTGLRTWALLGGGTLALLLLCVCVGSVRIPLAELPAAFNGGEYAAVLSLRLPRVLCAALTGAALSVCGGAMQGLLRNPLADGSTLGVSAGASLGAALCIAFGVSVPGLPFAGTAGMAMLFAFGSLVVILTLSFQLDRSFSTNTIILVGVIFSMFVTSLLNLVVTLAATRVRQITFWTMGSLAGCGYGEVAALAVVLALCGGRLVRLAPELNALAVDMENARHVGVDVRRVRLSVLLCVAALTGVCVAIGGVIGFVGLVAPHMTRLLTGPDHKRLLPALLFSGAAFVMLADLLARTVLRPMELPIGVLTSLVGAVLFVILLYRARRKP